MALDALDIFSLKENGYKSNSTFPFTEFYFSKFWVKNIQQSIKPKRAEKIVDVVLIKIYLNTLKKSRIHVLIYYCIILKKNLNILSDFFW